MLRKEIRAILHKESVNLEEEDTVQIFLLSPSCTSVMRCPGPVGTDSERAVCLTKSVQPAAAAALVGQVLKAATC